MKKNTILLVEDDELDAISVERSLKKSGKQYELHIAFNGKEALTLLQKNPSPVTPDVIILDLSMPRMNGIEFLKNLRSEERLKELKVFVITTSTDYTMEQTARQLGISGYYIKPLNYVGNTKKPDSMDAFFQFHLRQILS